eukprot:tig00021493_g21911.t1
MSKATGCEGSLDFNTDEGDGPVGLDSKVLNAAGVVQAKAVQEPLQGRRLGLESRRAPGSGMGLARGAELLDGVGRSSARGPGAGPRRT